MQNTKFILVNVRGNIIPMTEEEYRQFRSDMDSFFEQFQ
jgi:hypothetical protein